MTPRRGQDSFAYQRCSGACAVEVHAGEAAAVTGTTIVHSRADGTTWGTDATTGRELWRRPADGKRPGRSPDSQGRTLALPLVFGTSERDFLTYFDPDVVRTVDPVSGRRTGARVARLDGERASVHAAGERLVITLAGRDRVVDASGT